jgi:hypothetical protein
MPGLRVSVHGLSRAIERGMSLRMEEPTGGEEVESLAFESLWEFDIDMLDEMLSYTRYELKCP